MYGKFGNSGSAVVMRRNVQLEGRYMRDDYHEHSLIQPLKALRKQIYSWQQQWRTIDPTVCLLLLSDIIKSDETGVPITEVVLSSVYKILTLGMLDVNAVNQENAIHMVVDAVTSHPFEVIGLDKDYYGGKRLDNSIGCLDYASAPCVTGFPSYSSIYTSFMNHNALGLASSKEAGVEMHLATEPCGFPRMVEMFHFLYSLLNNVEHVGTGHKSNP